jgi:hypothetical protein
MAINAETLDAIDGAQYGPVRFSASTAGLVATFDGKTALVAVDGAAVKITSSGNVPWPQAGLSQDVERRIQAAFALLALTRPELLTIQGDGSSSSATVTLWLDADTSNVPDLAVGVRTAVLLTDAAWRAVDQVAFALLSEARVMRDTVEAQARLEEAQRALSRIEQQPGPPPAQPVPPQPPAAPARRQCPRCGTQNSPDARFCIGCGQSLPA